MLKENVIKAYNFAKAAHHGQMRKYSKREYFVHPKYVARIIEDITGDETMIIAALLHDVLEDTEAKQEEIKKEFGEEVLNIVKELTNKKLKDENKLNYMIRILPRLSEKALTIKLADRYHNVKFLNKDCTNIEERKFIKKYLKETIAMIEKLKFMRLNEAQETLFNGIQFECKYLLRKMNFNFELKLNTKDESFISHYAEFLILKEKHKTEIYAFNEEQFNKDDTYKEYSELDLKKYAFEEPYPSFFYTTKKKDRISLSMEKDMELIVKFFLMLGEEFDNYKQVTNWELQVI